jgi:hypothetical protein
MSTSNLEKSSKRVAAAPPLFLMIFQTPLPCGEGSGVGCWGSSLKFGMMHVCRNQNYLLLVDKVDLHVAAIRSRLVHPHTPVV